MSRAERPVLLVGAMPWDSAEETFRNAGPIVGDLAIGLTDGEFGLRRFWIFYVCVNTWFEHPDLDVVRMPKGIPDMPEWVPTGYDDMPWVQLKAGTDTLRPIATLGYPQESSASYALFCKMREEGVIPAGVRFQQSLPFPDDAARLFTNDPATFDAMTAAYAEVLERDIKTLCDSIPHEDLVIQWDINWETIALEHGDHMPDVAPMQFAPTRPALDRYTDYVRRLSAVVPAAVPLGRHLCYGDLHHQHCRDPNNVATSVAMANAAADVSARPLNFVQMSVPRHRNDDAFFEPLADLRFGDGTVYAGLVHYTDGVEGSVDRLAAFKRHYDGPTGVSTECGLGRRPHDQDIAKLLQMHCDIAAGI